MKFQFGIDRGGTFTDIFTRCPNGKIVVMKLLSVDSSYEDAPREGIRRIIQQETGVEIPKTAKIDASQIDWIRMGTTVATNALLERKGERMALLITEGFEDLLQIGNQARGNLFDLRVPMPEMLYEKVIQVKERLLTYREDVPVNGNETVQSTNTGKILVATNVEIEKLKSDLKNVLKEGITSLAVCFLHSYNYPCHEQLVGRLAKEMGFEHVSLSSEVMSMIRAVPRGLTTAADAYLTPLIHNYVKTFSSGFENLSDSSVLFMKSDGGLTPMADFCGSRAILSGPAGGVVGYARTSFNGSQPVIGFDMGGTSTDVSRFDGHYEHTYESTTAGITIQAPQLSIETVAAGGGSILHFRSGIFCVGPHSAGALPGPISYKKGGKLPTVTDANLVLGRLIPEFFPKIFGPNDDEMIDKEGVYQHFTNEARQVSEFLQRTMTVEEVAMGFIEVANEAMCRVIRNITQGKGHDTSTHVLSCFGGAGGQHACAVARNLGINKVIVPRYAGILSAYGLALADIVHEEQEPCGIQYSPDNLSYISGRFEVLKGKCAGKLKATNIDCELYLHLRYEGTDCALMCLGENENFLETFTRRYEQEFGFTIKNRNVIVDDIRVRGILKSPVIMEEGHTEINHPVPISVVRVYFENGYESTNVYKLSAIANSVIEGPSIIMDDLSTILIEPNCRAEINGKGDILISILDCSVRSIGTDLDTIQLSIFSHRFMSIAEQMGRVLQRTSISTNIKERLDFSCAIFGPDGGLVSNAPHIPVHLGAMQEAVQYQLMAIGHELQDGDVILSNHPCAGGSHLPDLTVITPVFQRDVGKQKPIFFVASRGHHADIGGITPGSMPPHSKSLTEEGAIFKSFKLVKSGEFQEQELIDTLNEPAKYPGGSGTRNLKDNLSDLRAQVAANRKGIGLIYELIESYGLRVVQAYMMHIQENAELSVREMLKSFSSKLNSRNLHAEDFMDDGSKICLSVSIDSEGGATFDFTGTGYEVYGNTNAPKAITVSAIIYCLRCLVGEDIPLNQGCLKPIKIIIPEKSILNPSEDSAVVGGNVLTSQRVVDVILKAFQACAASQGCMNNVTFGDETVGYYETVAGGAGAGPTWHGTPGVHTHMTNTRITDPEILETRYPVILKHFSLERNTGGKGRFNGGDGVRREIQFRKKMKLSILTERRVFQPYGICGGLGGSRGQNLLERDGYLKNLGGKCFLDCQVGDKLILRTPGGGGYGIPR